MAINSSKSPDGNTITITMPPEFDFHSHKEFRQFQTNSTASTKFVLDFAQTRFIDSSALGMLLLMREELGGDRSRIKLINCQKTIRGLLEMANFHKLFDVA